MKEESSILYTTCRAAGINMHLFTLETKIFRLEGQGGRETKLEIKFVI